MQKLKKYDWIDFGRALAILLVIMVHTGKSFPGISFKDLTDNGDMGVQLFFILSAFTLYNSYQRRYHIDKQKRAVFFFIRRFFRISPLYYLAAIFYTLFYVFIKGVDSVEYWKVLAAVFYVNGIIIPAINYNIPPGAWSIGTEMLFYLCVPILFAKIKTLKSSVYLLLASILFSNIINFINFKLINSLTSYDYNYLREYHLYFWIPNQFPVFCFGITLFHLFNTRNFNDKSRFYFTWLSIILFISCSQINFSFEYPTYFFQREYVFSFIFTLFIIGIKDRQIDNRFADLIKNIGKFSFGMYLTHFFVLIIFNYIYLHYYTFKLSNLSFALSFLAVTGATYIIASYLYKFEKLGIEFGNRLIDRMGSNPSNK